MGSEISPFQGGVTSFFCSNACQPPPGLPCGARWWRCSSTPSKGGHTAAKPRSAVRVEQWFQHLWATWSYLGFRATCYFFIPGPKCLCCLILSPFPSGCPNSFLLDAFPLPPPVRWGKKSFKRKVWTCTRVMYTNSFGEMTVLYFSCLIFLLFSYKFSGLFCIWEAMTVV